MIEVVLIVALLLVVIPVAVMVLGGVLAAVLGFFLNRDSEERYAGTEHLQIS